MKNGSMEVYINLHKPNPQTIILELNGNTASNLRFECLDQPCFWDDRGLMSNQAGIDGISTRQDSGCVQKKTCLPITIGNTMIDPWSSAIATNMNHNIFQTTSQNKLLHLGSGFQGISIIFCGSLSTPEMPATNIQTLPRKHRRQSMSPGLKIYED